MRRRNARRTRSGSWRNQWTTQLVARIQQRSSNTMMSQARATQRHDLPLHRIILFARDGTICYLRGNITRIFAGSCMVTTSTAVMCHYCCYYQKQSREQSKYRKTDCIHHHNHHHPEGVVENRCIKVFVSSVPAQSQSKKSCPGGGGV